MDDDNKRTGWRRYAVGGALVASGLLAGAVLAATASANAADGTPSSSGGTPSAVQSASPGQNPPTGWGPGSQGPGSRDETRSMRPDEKLLTGDTATKVTAAARAKYPGATIERVETDSDGVYEAHLTTSAGARVTVEVNKAFAVTGTEQPAPH